MSHGIFSESGHPFNYPSKIQHPTQGNVPNHCPGALGYLDQQHLVSHPGPTLLSFRSKPAVGYRVVCCWQSGRPIVHLICSQGLLGRQSLYLQTHEIVKNGNSSPNRHAGQLNLVHLLPTAETTFFIGT
jgi:hypothetical protein